MTDFSEQYSQAVEIMRIQEKRMRLFVWVLGVTLFITFAYLSGRIE